MDQPRGLRITEELKNTITTAAKEDERSYSAEIRYLVKLGLERRNRDKAFAQSGQEREFADFIAQHQESQVTP